MKPIKIVTAIACEYVARGHANKHTLINVYGGDILVAEFPAIFPMAFYLELEPSFDEPTPVKLEIMRDRTVLAGAESEVPPLPEGMNVFVVALPQFPLSVPGPCKVTVYASVPGQRKVALLSKTIRQLVSGPTA